MLCDYFSSRMQFDLKPLLINLFGVCPNHTFWGLIAWGTDKQRGRAHLAKINLLNKSSIWLCSFQTSSHLFVKKGIRSFQHYISFLHIFDSHIYAIPPPFFELHCHCIVTQYWASQMICNSLKFIISASYNCLAHKEFKSLIDFLQWVFNFSNSRAVKINNYSNYDQSIKIDTGLLYNLKIKFERGAAMMSFWLKLRNVWTRHRPKMNYSSLGDNFILVTFHIETISQKRIALPENQFNYKQIQGVNFNKIHKNQFIW